MTQNSDNPYQAPQAYTPKDRTSPIAPDHSVGTQPHQIKNLGIALLALTMLVILFFVITKIQRELAQQESGLLLLMGLAVLLLGIALIAIGRFKEKRNKHPENH